MQGQLIDDTSVSPQYVELSIDMPSQMHHSLFVMLFTNVRNAGAIRKALLNRELDAAVFDASLVASPTCIAAAAARALCAWERGDAVASSLHTELIYSFFGGKNVGDALRALGPRDVESMDLLVALFYNNNNNNNKDDGGNNSSSGDMTMMQKKRQRIVELVDGPVSDIGLYYGVDEWIKATDGNVYAGQVVLPSRADTQAIANLYKISTEEMALPPSTSEALVAAVLSRIAIKALPIGNGGGGGGGSGMT